MDPKITPEIQMALEQHPIGPIRLEGVPGSAPVYLVRMDDVAYLQDLVNSRIKEKLSEADRDIAADRVVDWKPVELKARGHERLAKHRDQ